MDVVIIDSYRNTFKLTLPDNPRTDEKGEYYIPCPICSPTRSEKNRNQKKLAVNYKITHRPWRCNHCGESGALITDKKKNIDNSIKPITKSFALNKIDDDFANAIKENWSISKATLNYFKVMTVNISMLQVHVPKGEEEYQGKYRTVPAIYFPSYDGKDLIDVQYRDGNKNFQAEKGGTKIFFNINDLKGAKIGMITEGRKDTMSVFESKCEIPCCSVPNGVSMSPNELEYFEKHGIVDIKKQLDLKYLDVHYWVFEEMETVIIGTDDDPPGIKLREELARRIGKHKCKYIKWGDWKRKDNTPCKDANDVLVECGAEELKNAWRKAKSFPISGIIRINEVLDDLLFERENGKEKGLSIGFPSLEPHFSIMPGHLIVTNGFRNMGKTAWILQIALHMIILHGWKVALYMPENYPVKRLVDKMVQMLLGKSTDKENDDHATEAEIRQAAEFIQEYIFIVHETGRKIYSHPELRNKAEELIAKHGIKMFVKDPWNRVRQERMGKEQPFDYLDRELSEEAFFAEQTNIAWFINAHPKTPDVPKNLVLRRPSDHELYGGEVWGSKAHEIMTLHRESTGADNNESFLYIDKTKDHEIIGIPCPNTPVKLGFHRKSQRFYDFNDSAFETNHILDRWKHGLQTNIVGF